MIKTALILAGGKGNRMGSLGKIKPKCLLNVNNKPILSYIINELYRNNIKNIIIAAGYKHKMIKEYVNEKFKNKNIMVINTGKNTEINDRIDAVKKYIKTDKFLLLNGDTIFKINLNKINSNSNSATFIVSNFSIKFGVLTLSNNNINFKRGDYYQSLNKKNEKYFVYTGFCILQKNLLFKYNIKKMQKFESQFFNIILKKEKCKIYFCNKMIWYPIDTEYELQQINNLFNKKTLK